MANRKVKFNISNLHYAPITAVEDGVPTFGKPVAIPGAKTISMEPKGESTVFYADGIEYYVSSANMGYEGDLEIAMLPDEFREAIFKEIKDAKGVLLEDTGAEPEAFALGFQIDGNTKNTKFWFYNAKATRAGVSAKSNENAKNPDTDTIKVSASPTQILKSSDKMIARSKTTDTTDPTAYTNWFTAVYVPESLDPGLPAAASVKK